MPSAATAGKASSAIATTADNPNRSANRPPMTPPIALPAYMSAVAVAAIARGKPTDSTATGIQLERVNTVIEFAT